MKKSEFPQKSPFFEGFIQMPLFFLVFCTFFTSCDGPGKSSVSEKPSDFTQSARAANSTSNSGLTDDSGLNRNSGSADDAAETEAPLSPLPLEGENSDAEAENDAFSQGEKAAEDAASGVSESELDRYIEDDEYMFEHLKLDAPIFEPADSLKRLHPEKPIWIDTQRKHVVLQGCVCQTKVMLEFFLCSGTGGVRTFPYEDETGKPAKMMMFNGPKCHESIFCTEVPGHVIHAGLLALGAEVGEPVKFQPEFEPPTGDEIEVTICWRDENGNVVTHRGQELAVDADGKSVPVAWVFAGSLFYDDGAGQKRYAADMEGEYIGISNFPSVILDVAEASSSSNDDLVFIANEKILPPRGTPVTIILSRKEGEK